MIRTALVGVSGYGRWHLLMVLEQMLLGRVALVGVTVINQEEQEPICRRLRRQGVPVFSTFEEMMSAVAGRVDLLLLPTGIQWHTPMTLAALNAGAHVLVEKPVAATVAEVDAVIAAQRAANRLVAVGYQDLYDPGTHAIKQQVLAGRIGGLRQIRVRGQWPRSSTYYSRNGWAGRLRIGDAWVLDSPVNNAFAHFLMLALFWAGDTADAIATIAEVEAELYRVSQIESFDTASLRLRSTAGVEILMYVSHAGRQDSAPEVMLVGETGRITWTYERSCVLDEAGVETDSAPVPSQLDVRLHVLDRVIDRLEGDPGFVVTPAMVREHTRVINAVHEFFPIRDVPNGQVETESGAGGVFRRIRNLDEILELAAGRGQLFSEAGAPWATAPAGPRSLAGYRGWVD